jgi:hypothetical protein
MSIPVPIISSIPFDFLDPLKRIPFGQFGPDELAVPPSARLEFELTAAMWTAGFVACAAGLAWLANAAAEHENDRIHATIHTLPPGVAALVERLLPEERWAEIGLHGLSQRLLCKRIEALVQERMAERRDFDALLRRTPLLPAANPSGFAGEIEGALAQDSVNSPDASAPRSAESS